MIISLYENSQFVSHKCSKDCTYTVDSKGRLHSKNDNVAVIIHKDGIKYTELWYYHGEIHRGNGKPARIEYYESGEVMCAYWYDHNKIHRDNDHPAIEYHIDKTRKIAGQKIMSFWYTNDMIHRDDDKPAVLHYVFTQHTYIMHNYWYINDKLYRDPSKGPAFVTKVMGKDR